MKFIYPFQAPQIYILLLLIQQNETKTGNAATKVKNMSYIPADKNIISQKKIGQLFIQDTAGTLAISSIMQV